MSSGKAKVQKNPATPGRTTGNTTLQGTPSTDTVDPNTSNESTEPVPSDLQDAVSKETNRMISEIRRLQISFFNNRVTPERKEKMFKKIAKRCFNEIDCLNSLHFVESTYTQQAELRSNVDTRLDAVRKDIAKLKKLASDLESINECNENHVCRDMKNFFI